MFNYRIENNNLVVIYNNENDSTLVQPCWPNGTAWANKEEAESWAQTEVNFMNDPSIKIIAGFSPEEPTVSVTFE